MGRVETFELDIAPLGQSPRTIYAYLPNDYDTSKKTYPVLYMFDGHNLFDNATATYGKSWGIREYLEQNDIPLVVIGQDCNHTGYSRLGEYCPLPVRDSEWFPDIPTSGEITAEWFVNTLKPECEKRYRIRRDRKHVGIGGSSMGGLMSMYCVTKYNSVYSKAACVSSSMDICLDSLLDLIAGSEILPSTRIYLDFGSNEVKRKSSFARCVDNLLRLNHAWSEKGAKTYPHIVVDGMHSEASWETIVPVFIQYLYPELF
ncbi:MAG: alpha/beta hydrolase [Erysipelotrichaceae bacterium]|nr:alpha/beta hydrolase [Erysipelotrichaceae bacterium]